MRTELKLVFNLDKSTKFRSLIFYEKLFSFVNKRTVISTDTYFLHHHIRITIPSYRYLIVTQSNQQHWVSSWLIFKVNPLEDGIRWIGSILHVKKRIFPARICELCLIIFLTQLTFGLLIGIKKSVIMLSLDHIFRNPILETLKVDILNCSRTFAQTHQRIDTVIAIFKTNPANLVKTTHSTQIWNTFHLHQIIVKHTIWLEISLCHLFLLFNYFLEPQLDFPEFDKGAILKRMHFPIFDDPPKALVVLIGSMQFDNLTINFELIKHPVKIVLGIINDIFSIMTDIRIRLYLLIDYHSILIRIEIKQLKGLSLTRLYTKIYLPASLGLTHREMLSINYIISF